MKVGIEMIRSNQKLLSITLVLSILMIIGLAVHAESYTSTLNVSSRVEGTGRYYSGSTINCKCSNAYLSTVFNTTADTLRIGCFKRGFLGFYYEVGSSVVGTVSVDDYTTVSGSWTMDGNGTYRFRFEKGIWNGMQEKILSSQSQCGVINAIFSR